jgi:hypothetical protein
MKNRFLIILIVLIPICSFGQNDTIRNEILNNSDSKSEIISKGRRLLLDKFIEGDIQKVKEIKDYLINDVENADYVAFYPIEYWLLLYWTQEYDELTESITGFDSFKSDTFEKSIKPQDDFLFEKVRSKTRDSKFILQIFIEDSDLEDVDKAFLSMNLNNLIADNDYRDITQDTLNILADNFLLKYPNSIYENYTRNYIRYKLTPSKFGLAFEFFSGYGIFTENLEENFQNNVPIGVAFDIYYKDFVLYLRDYIGFSKTKDDINYHDGIWEKKSQVRVYLPEASLGYVVLDKKYLKIAPFGGIASIDIGPTQHDLDREPDLEKAELEFTTTYTFGLNLDIKLGPSKIPMVTFGPEQSYLFLRVRYAYSLPQFRWKYHGYNGNMHYLTIGIEGFGRKLKREY